MTTTYLVWSNEHGAWWRPGGHGYTQQLDDAGRFTPERAAAIVVDAGYHGPGGLANEVTVVAPEHSWHGRQ